MFRYVIGGAIDVRGVSYVNFLVPGFVVSGLIFTAGGSAVAVAEDAASGRYDRLRSLPIADVAVLAGRALGDATLMVFVSLMTLLVDLAVGFRFAAVRPMPSPRWVWSPSTPSPRLGLRVARTRQRQRPGRPRPRHHWGAVLIPLQCIRTDPLNARRAAALRRAPATHVHGQRRPRTRDRRRRRSPVSTTASPTTSSVRCCGHSRSPRSSRRWQYAPTAGDSGDGHARGEVRA